MGEKLSINPWLGMWIRPRETIRAIIRFNSLYLLPLLYWIYGVPLLLQVAQNFSLGDRYSLVSILGGSVILAILAGFIGINIGSALFCWMGKWIGGQGSFKEVRAAVAWSSIPAVVNIVVWAIQISMFGQKTFSLALFNTPFVGSQLAITYLTSVVQIVVTIWGIIMLLKALGEAQRFSAWKALLNVFMPLIVIFIGLKLLVWLFTLLSSGLH